MSVLARHTHTFLHAHHSAHPPTTTQGAARPREEEFSETPVGDSDDDVPDYLQGLDRETPVMVGDW